MSDGDRVGGRPVREIEGMVMAGLLKDGPIFFLTIKNSQIQTAHKF